MTFRIMAVVCLCLFASPALADWQGTIVEASGGGDILTVHTNDNRNLILQLYGIDCPELGQPYGKEAQQKVYDLVVKPGKPVVVLEERRDSTGQIFATIILHDNTTLNARLLLAGLAWVYTPNCVDTQYCQAMIKLQTKAQSAKIGLWADENPIPPWEWKRDNQ